eukprot:4661387-Prymnesium_polylepis.1
MREEGENDTCRAVRWHSLLTWSVLSEVSEVRERRQTTRARARRLAGQLNLTTSRSHNEKTGLVYEYMCMNGSFNILTGTQEGTVPHRDKPA